MSLISTADNIIPMFNKFSRFIAESGESLSPKQFSKEFIAFQRQALSSQSRDVFCSQADKLAENMLQDNNNDFAGIIYSSLCKITEFIPNELEKFALRGYEVAKSNGDYVHMMARLNDLRKVYTRRPEKLYDYIQVLYKQEKCLKQLTNHYDKSVGTYQSVIRKPASQEEYRQMLAYVQTEIGKLTKKKHPNDAMKKLLNAREIFLQSGNKQSVDYIDMLIREIQMSLKPANK